MRALVTVAVMLTLAALTSGCGLVMAEGATVIGTEKTIGDHIVSWTSNKDCSTYRKNTGRTYCKEDDIQPKPRVHCYRTLASVTCYEKPEKSGRRREVGDNSHNIGNEVLDRR